MLHADFTGVDDDRRRPDDDQNAHDEGGEAHQTQDPAHGAGAFAANGRRSYADEEGNAEEHETEEQLAHGNSL
jgi:hypothetical protein